MKRLTLSLAIAPRPLRPRSPTHYPSTWVGPTDGGFLKHPSTVMTGKIMLACITVYGLTACEPTETEVADEQAHTITTIEEKTLSTKSITVAASAVHRHDYQAGHQAGLNSNNPNHNPKHSQSSKVAPDYQFTPKVVQPVQINTSASTAASRIVESLKLSQAKLAANSRDKCPKLIVPNVDSSEIVREGEMMTSDYCDYYVYPSPGQTLYVSSYPDTTQSTLIAPVVYDFENGRYRANSADKHTIRIADTGSESRFDPLTYDVVIAVE